MDQIQYADPDPQSCVSSRENLKEEKNATKFVR